MAKEDKIITDSVYWSLQNVNISKKLKTKVGQKYLSWSYAWSEVKKRYPDANYIVYENKKKGNMPIWGTPEIGYFVKVSVTINFLSHESRLPIMNAANKAIKDRGYSYQGWNKEKNSYELKKVDPLDVMHINKTVQRALVKAIAMHGLGLNVWKGEDLPEVHLEKISKDHEKSISEELQTLDEVTDLNAYFQELRAEYIVEENIKKLFSLRKEEIEQNG
jgi:hypothetical protein